MLIVVDIVAWIIVVGFILGGPLLVASAGRIWSNEEFALLFLGWMIAFGAGLVWLYHRWPCGAFVSCK